VPRLEPDGLRRHERVVVCVHVELQQRRGAGPNTDACDSSDTQLRGVVRGVSRGGEVFRRTTNVCKQSGNKRPDHGGGRGDSEQIPYAQTSGGRPALAKPGTTDLGRIAWESIRMVAGMCVRKNAQAIARTTPLMAMAAEGRRVVRCKVNRRAMLLLLMLLLVLRVVWRPVPTHSLCQRVGDVENREHVDKRVIDGGGPAKHVTLALTTRATPQGGGAEIASAPPSSCTEPGTSSTELSTEVRTPWRTRPKPR
jgi:hypothetical protein